MNNDMLISYLIQIEDRIAGLEENMITRRDFHALLSTQDHILTILKRMDIEQTSIISAIKRHDQRIVALER